MRWLWTSLRRVYRLFVEDGGFELAILVWVGLIAAGLLQRLRPPAQAEGPILFAGLAAIFLISAARRAGR